MDVPEAPLEPTEHGVQPKGEGWFVVNTGELEWETVDGGGTWCVFDAPDAPSDQLGIGLHQLPPGESSGFYHRETDQEGFLVLAGECLLIVEGQERPMRAWDYFHCPPGTDHMIVGAGDGPCTLLMVGTRRPGHAVHYPVDPVAAKHGVSVQKATNVPREAYAGRPPFRAARSVWP